MSREHLLAVRTETARVIHLALAIARDFEPGRSRASHDLFSRERLTALRKISDTAGPNPPVETIDSMFMTVSLLARSEPGAARELSQKALDAARTAHRDDHVLFVRALLWRGRASIEAGDRLASLADLRMALDTARSRRLGARWDAECEYTLAVHLARGRSFAEAEPHFLEAIEGYTNCLKVDGAGQANFGYAILLRETGRLAEARERGMQAFRQLLGCRDVRLLGTCAHAIANIELEAHRPLSALEFFERSLARCAVTENLAGVASVLQSVSHLAARYGAGSLAIEAIEEATTIFGALNIPGEAAGASAARAVLIGQLRQSVPATRSAFRHAEQVAEALSVTPESEPGFWAELWIGFAESLLSRRRLGRSDLADALVHARDAASLAGECGDPRLKSQATTLWRTAAERIGDPAEAARAAALDEEIKPMAKDKIPKRSRSASMGRRAAELWRLERDSAIEDADRLRDVTSRVSSVLLDVRRVLDDAGDSPGLRAESDDLRLRVADAITRLDSLRIAPPAERRVIADRWPFLSEEELEICVLTMEGLSEKEICRELHIPAGASKVRDMRLKILRRLEANGEVLEKREPLASFLQRTLRHLLNA